MEEQEFNRLIRKYQLGLLSGTEKAILDEWFAQMARDDDPTGWTEEDRLRLKRKILREIAEKNVSIDLSSPKYRALAWKIAASVLLLSICTFVVWKLYPVKPPEPIAESSASLPGEIRKLILADGSLVWLKGNSSLTYPREFHGNVRAVTLQGEALFEVAPDAAHPFTIQCGELTTTVLGTSFNIRSAEKDIEVVVLTGKVSLTSKSDRKGIVLLPHEKAFYRADDKRIEKIVTEVPKAETIAAVAGTEYVMSFEDTRMNEVIRRISEKFNVTFSLSDSSIGNCMITADFTGQSLGGTMNMIAQALALDYDIEGGVVALRGVGCK